MSDPLITKYRPQTLEEFEGNRDAVIALSNAALDGGRPHTYLFTGPSGIGKTTLARIMANELKAEILEIDAASNNGVDAMRDLVESAALRPLSGAHRRMIIVDECHVISKPGWQVLLKTLEEPPDHLFFALCTTEISKVPETIVTRCYHAQLRPLRTAEMEGFLGVIAELEQWNIVPEVLSVIVRESTGQPRKGLSLLQAAHSALAADEAMRIIAMSAEKNNIIDLVKLFISGAATWESVNESLCRIEPDEWGDAGLIACRYVAGVMARTKKQSQIQVCMMIISTLASSSPFDPKIAFLAAVGNLCERGVADM